jgi:hypothetical protein
MSMTNAAETDFLELLFQNLDWPNVGDAAGLQNSATAGDIFVSLHTGDPGETGTQTTSEATYTGYARVAVVRSSAGWTISGNTADNTAAITFGACTAGSSTVTYFGLGSALSGAGNLYMSGALTASLAVTAGITPQFAIGVCDVVAD